MIGNETSGLIISNPSRLTECIIHALKKEEFDPNDSKVGSLASISDKRNHLLSKENEKMRSLLQSIWSLTNWAQGNVESGLGDRDDRRCVVGFDFAGMSFGWYEQFLVDGKWETRIVGGLIYHPSSDSWSIHT